VKQLKSTFTAQPADIDELGHVNNAVWVTWIQDIAVAHWNAIASAEQAAAYVWVIIRHEIDYRGNLSEGECVEARTWVADGPQGAKWDRFVEFRKDGRVVVSAKTTWAILDRASGRLIRVPKDVVGRFV
jgi:acyl-CoA thioester hydrolase